LPEGTTMDLDISDGHARVDLSAEALNSADAEAESAMVQAVVNTLTEFPTVKDVQILIDGQKRSRLTHGTDVSARMQRMNLNLESDTATVSAFSTANHVQLYFPSESGRLLVPVTRTVYSDADVETAIFEFLKGPKDDSGLEQPLPEETGLLGVNVKDGVATINFTGEFMDVAQNSDGGVQAMRALMLTCTQFPGVKKVEVLVDGEKYRMPLENAPTFANIESEVVETFPEVMSVE
jgi:germination protein M